MRSPLTHFALIGLAVAVTFSSRSALADITLKPVVYHDGDVELTGYVAYDEALAADGKKLPGVMIVHEWWGNNEYARYRAKEIAKLGYVAFAADIYGTGKIATTREEASKWAGEMRNDTATWRRRAMAGFNEMKKQPQVDTDKLAAIGYCFGGSTVLQLAFAGADLDAVVSFHGGLMTPTPEEAAAVKARVLICHGADDSFVSPESITGLTDALTAAKVDWQMIYYAHAVHTFTNPDADKAAIKGVAYNEKADKRSWQHMRQLFEEVFGS